MRKVVLVLLMTVLVLPTVFAGVTDKADFDRDLGCIGELLQHDHQTYTASRKTPVNIEVDVVVYKCLDNNVEVLVGGTRDIANDESSVRAGVKVDLFGMLK